MPRTPNQPQTAEPASMVRLFKADAAAIERLARRLERSFTKSDIISLAVNAGLKKMNGTLTMPDLDKGSFVRLRQVDNRQVNRMTRKTGRTRGTLIREAVRLGLPELLRQYPL